MAATLTPQAKPADTVQAEAAAERLQALLLAREARKPEPRAVASNLHAIEGAPAERFNELLISVALRVTVSRGGGQNRAERMQTILYGQHDTPGERADARRFVRAYSLLRRLVLTGVKRRGKV